MSIEKKSLISTLKTTKKANAAKDDITGSAAGQKVGPRVLARPLAPKARPIAPKARPLAPKARPIAPKARPLGAKARPLAPKA
jgi:hypothetical protein